jgi:hypothetical protein
MNGMTRAILGLCAAMTAGCAYPELTMGTAPSGGKVSKHSGGTTSRGGTSGKAGATLTAGGTATGGGSSTGGKIATGGLNTTGGATATGGLQSTGGATATGGLNTTGGATATGGLSSNGGTTSTGGIAAGGVRTSATGGTTVIMATGGTSTTVVAATGGAITTANGGGTNPPATAASCTIDLMTLLGGTKGDWLAFDNQKSCGMQGSVYGFGDGTTCTIADTGICTGGKCCISGKTAAGKTADDYANYGCGIGFDLNASAGSASNKYAYTTAQGPAKGFTLGISGTVAVGQKIRIKFAPAASASSGGVFPYTEVTTVAAAGGAHLFAEVRCPDWALSPKCSIPTSSTGVYSMQIELVGGGTETGVGTFTDFCLTSLTPIL